MNKNVKTLVEKSFMNLTTEELEIFESSFENLKAFKPSSSDKVEEVSEIKPDIPQEKKRFHRQDKKKVLTIDEKIYKRKKHLEHIKAKQFKTKENNKFYKIE